MTSREFAEQMPRLTVNPIPYKPLFEFRGLSARVFPLRANLDSLQRLCNGYLNIVPPEVGWFRASLPYVYLSVLDYGQVSETLTNLGWFSQIETFFCVPVEWYRRVNGRWIFQDWGVITPFIFVNDDMSAPLGRTLAGFPKTIARLIPTESDWVSDPMTPTVLARVETAVFPELYEGRRLERRTFVEVVREAPMTNFRLPFDAASPMAPWVLVSNVIQAMTGFARDATWMAQSMRIAPINPMSSPAFGPEMLRRLVPALAPGGEGFVVNSLNLKQFRASGDTSLLCYQALTNGRMQTTAINGGGLLGEERTLLGDMSGGYSIRLYEYPSLPIARKLGLDVERRWHGDGVDVALVRPVMPFWMNANITYDVGRNLAWRAHDGVWRNDDGGLVEESPSPVPEPRGPMYDTALDSAVDSVAGPFEFTGTTIRVLPLLARRATLQAFLDARINSSLAEPVRNAVGDGRVRVRLSVWGRQPTKIGNFGLRLGGEYAYVYLTASSFGGVTSESNNVGDWAKYELSFLVPVRWEREETPGSDVWTLEAVGLVPAYTFVDDSTAAVARGEVLGIPTNRANFLRPENNWMSDEDPSFRAQQTLLRVDAEVMPALGLGQKATVQPIVEISADLRGPRLDGLTTADARFEWAHRLKDELAAKKATQQRYPNTCRVGRALAMELLGNGTPISLYTLKQFPDISHPDRACYQALVRIPRTLVPDVDVREIHKGIQIQIHDFPTLPIVSSLGLIARSIDNDSAGLSYGLQAIRPFYIHGTMREGVGERLLSRAGTLDWQLTARAFDTMISDTCPPEREPGVHSAFTVDAFSESLVDLGDPTRLAVVVRASTERRRENAENGGYGVGDNSGRPPITRTQARAALSRLDPQIVIEAVLSREWSNFDENALWRQGRRRILDTLARLGAGETPDTPVLEAASFAAAFVDIADRPGQVLSCTGGWQTTQSEVDPGNPDSTPGVVERMIHQMKEFVSAELRVDEPMRVITAWGLQRSAGERIDKVLLAGVPRKDDEQAVGTSPPKPSSERTGGRRELLADLKIAPKAVAAAVGALLAALQTFPTDVIGEPSPHYNLSPDAHAAFSQFRKLRDDLVRENLSEGDPLNVVERLWGHLEQLREVVELAHKCVGVQREALLNKLARAYQKPDFCISRDTVSPEQDWLLPIDESWDELWFSGNPLALKRADTWGVGPVLTASTLDDEDLKGQEVVKDPTLDLDLPCKHDKSDRELSKNVLLCKKCGEEVEWKQPWPVKILV